MLYMAEYLIEKLGVAGSAMLVVFISALVMWYFRQRKNPDVE